MIAVSSNIFSDNITMEDFLSEVTSDFRDIATNTGFKFNQYCGPVNWEYLDELEVEEADVNSLSILVASVLNYNIEKMSVSKKVFRLSQLIIDFLLHCKNHSTFKLNEIIVNSKALCKICGKMFIDVNYLNYHCFRRHGFKSCTFINSLDIEYVKSLKSQIDQLRTQLNEKTSIFQNKLQISKINQEQNCNDCNVVHKNKLLYHLIPQPGDNAMQIQEMYWKQKYDSLEENYKALKIECQKYQNMTKTTTVLHHKYQQCDNNIEKYSKYVQTPSLFEITTPVIYPKRPLRKVDVIYNQNNDIDSMDISKINQTNSKYVLCKDGSSDKDFCELNNLKREARMNIIENNICEDYTDPLLASDYVDSIKFILKLEQVQVNEIFNNDQLMDIIKFDIKEIVNKRFDDYYRLTKENDEQDKIFYRKNSNESQEIYEVSISKENNIEQHSSSKIDFDKNLIKKNKTVISKLKKKALQLSKVFSPDSKNKKIELQTTKQDEGISHSNDKINIDKDNVIS